MRNIGEIQTNIFNRRFPDEKDYIYYLCLAKKNWEINDYVEANNYIEISTELKDIRADKTIPINKLK